MLSFLQNHLAFSGGNLRLYVRSHPHLPPLSFSFAFINLVCPSVCSSVCLCHFTVCLFSLISDDCLNFFTVIQNSFSDDCRIHLEFVQNSFRIHLEFRQNSCYRQSFKLLYLLEYSTNPHNRVLYQNHRITTILIEYLREF